MTTEEIKKMVDDERAEQLTAQLCRHWEVATQRLEELVKDIENGMDTIVEVEIYAAAMRMQSSVAALMELNKIPTAFLFSEYLDRVKKTVVNSSVNKSVVALARYLLADESGKSKRRDSFFELVIQTMTQQPALPADKQKAIEQQFSPMDHIFAVCAQYMKSDDLLNVCTLIQEIKTEKGSENQEEIVGRLVEMNQAMIDLAEKMGENSQNLLICLLLVAFVPGIIVEMMQQSRTNSTSMAHLFNKVFMRVRESNAWWEYWQVQRETLRVVSNNMSWKQIMKSEDSKERVELGKVPGGLFAKWTTDRKAFDADFLNVSLSDEALRGFIFHLATLAEIARELDSRTKFGEEQLVRNETQQVGDAVLAAAAKLQDLTTEAWFPHYEAMWQELILDETIFAHLKVTRRSPHNDLFTARFFCHLVGEMKKRAVFGGHSDGDLAKKLTDNYYVGTFRKNIQEGMGEETENTRRNFDVIYLKYSTLVCQKK